MWGCFASEYLGKYDSNLQHRGLCWTSEFSKQLLWIQNLSLQNPGPLMDLFAGTGCRFLSFTVFLQTFTQTKLMLCHFCPFLFFVSLFQVGRVAVGQSALFSFPSQWWWIQFSLSLDKCFELDLATVTNIIPLFHTQLQAISLVWSRFEFISKRGFTMLM